MVEKADKISKTISKDFDAGLSNSGSGNNKYQLTMPQIMLNSRNSNPLKKYLPIKLYIIVSKAKAKLKKV